jgi:hypothetical protein
MTVSVTAWRSWKWARACARWSLVCRDLVTDETPCFVVGLRAGSGARWVEAGALLRIGANSAPAFPHRRGRSSGARGGKSLVDGLAAFVQPEIARSGGEGGDRRISHRSALALRLAVGLLKLLSRLLGCGFWWRVDRRDVSPQKPALGNIVGHVSNVAGNVRATRMANSIVADHRH